MVGEYSVPSLVMHRHAPTCTKFGAQLRLDCYTPIPLCSSLLVGVDLKVDAAQVLLVAVAEENSWHSHGLHSLADPSVLVAQHPTPVQCISFTLIARGILTWVQRAIRHLK